MTDTPKKDTADLLLSVANEFPALAERLSEARHEVIAAQRELTALRALKDEAEQHRDQLAKALRVTNKCWWSELIAHAGATREARDTAHAKWSAQIDKDTETRHAMAEALHASTARSWAELTRAAEALSKGVGGAYHDQLAGALQLEAGTETWGTLLDHARAGATRRRDLAAAIGAGPGCPWADLIDQAGRLYATLKSDRQIRDEQKESDRKQLAEALLVDSSRAAWSWPALLERVRHAAKTGFDAGKTLGVKETTKAVEANSARSLDHCRVELLEALGYPFADWRWHEALAKVRAFGSSAKQEVEATRDACRAELGRAMGIEVMTWEHQVAKVRDLAAARQEARMRLSDLWSIATGHACQTYDQPTHEALCAVIRALVGVWERASEARDELSGFAIHEVSHEHYTAFWLLERALRAESLDKLRKPATAGRDAPGTSVGIATTPIIREGDPVAIDIDGKGFVVSRKAPQ
jgi:hypothetical protein